MGFLLLQGKAFPVLGVLLLAFGVREDSEWFTCFFFFSFFCASVVAVDLYYTA